MASAEEPRQRLFFALWPDAELHRRIGHWADRCARPCGGKRVPDGNLHLTLAFLGAVTAAQRGCLEAVAETVRVAPFELSLDRIGFWARSHVLWLSASELPPALAELAAALRAAPMACGLRPDSKPFRVHLTLRRRASRPPAEREIPPIRWSADSFALVASDTLPSGARYEVVRRWPLAPAL